MNTNKLKQNAKKIKYNEEWENEKRIEKWDYFEVFGWNWDRVSGSNEVSIYRGNYRLQFKDYWLYT